MTRVRHGPAFASGMTATGFWLGITTGRVALGFVTPRVGEKVSVAVRPFGLYPVTEILILIDRPTSSSRLPSD